MGTRSRHVLREGIETVMFEVDPGSPIPIYHQLKSAIKKKIETGEFKPGERIPTEQELCERYAISRSPVRQALKELVYEGLLVRRRGLGTFVVDHAHTDTQSTIPVRLMTSDPQWAAVVERAVRRWNEGNPHRQADLQILLTEHKFHRALSTAVAEGTAPDMAMIDCVATSLPLWSGRAQDAPRLSGPAMWTTSVLTAWPS